MSIHTDQAQENFLRNGGVYTMVLAAKMEAGEIPREYVYREYPKMVAINPRHEDIEHVTEDVNRRTLTTTKRDVLIHDYVVVNSEEEEERVLSGGKTSAQVEDERQEMLRKARAAGIKTDPNWTLIRLKRELGVELDKPPAQADRLSVLESELAYERKLAAMQEEIDQLKARREQPADDVVEMRDQLTALGVAIDKRWGAARLRDELDRATAG